jgi:succinate dehydrogenase/fumarate reductase flavoprotein subunit
MLIEPGLTWHDSAEVVVVGYGAAGAATAIAARDAGADVLILEKQAEAEHLSTSALSGGWFLSFTDQDDAYRYMVELCTAANGTQWTDREVLRAFTAVATRIADQLEADGARLKRRPNGRGENALSEAGNFEACWFEGSGLGMMQHFKQRVAARGPRVAYGTPVRRLITDYDGTVLGLQATDAAGQVRNIRADGGVVLTLGGFEFDEFMKLNYLPVYPTHFYGSPANTGEGIRMATAAGADLWHMNSVSARMVAKFPDFPTAFTLDYGGRINAPGAMPGAGVPGRCGFAIVDHYGRRFTREDYKMHTVYYELALYDSQKLEFPRVPSYFVFDQRRIEAGQLPIRTAGAAGPSGWYAWSADNQTELERGWILRGETLADLARKIDIDPATLKRTIETYNAYARQGEDPEFGRGPRTLSPLDCPPYYAVALWPGGPNTQGGPRRNYRGEVMNVDREPIPGLYSNGELGSLYGKLYSGGGGNLTESFAFGVIAGESVARRARGAQSGQRISATD